MNAQLQLRKPSNWQDFELLCKKLWGEIWKCEDTIQRNGRLGQKQNGVDVYGIPLGRSQYYGVQCKGKDEYTHAQLTKTEIDNEIEKACNFKPALKRFIFASTSNKDAEIEEYIRCKNIENITSGGFEIFVSFWEDIVDLLEDNEKTYKWYLNNCQYKQVADVNIYIETGDDQCIHPLYARKHIKYVHKCNQLLENLGFTHHNGVFIPQLPRINMPSILGGPQEVNHSWCELSITIENTGSVMLDHQKLEISFSSEEIEAVDDMFHIGIFDTDLLKQMKVDNREVFEYSDDPYGLEIDPLKPIVAKDSRSFKFRILPHVDAEEINIQWRYFSNGFNKDGDIRLTIAPKFKEVEVTESTEFLGEVPEPREEMTHFITVE